MARSILALFLVVCGLLPSPMEAQDDPGLTREFGNLSAKERARIAKKEQEEAAADPAYQAVMSEAEALFQRKRYDESLERFKQARTIRPLNVYPKVKIQDLQALIAKRDAARAQAVADSLKASVPPVVPPPVFKDSLPPVASELPPATNSLPPAKTAPARSSAPVPQKVDVREKPVERVPAVKPQPNIASPPGQADGPGERTYLEGRAIVLERRLMQSGRLEVYRKVTHPWGQIVHFRDGIAISEREWNETFP